MFKFNKGFTLIEILVGISIVSILSGTVLLNLSGVRDTAQDTVQDFSITTQVAELERRKIKSRSAEVRAKIQEIQDSLRQIEEADKVLKISTSTSQQKQVATQKKQESTAKLNEQKEELVDLTEKEKKVVNKRGSGNPFSIGFITQLPKVPKEFKFDSKIDFNNQDIALGDHFLVTSVSISSKGNTLVVGTARNELGEKGEVYISQKDSDGNFTSPKKISSETAKLTLHNQGLYGDSVAITKDGNTVVVSSAFDDTGGQQRGAVYIFTKKDSDSNFTSPKKISSETEGLTLKNGALFGRSVAITPDGNTLVVGAVGNTFVVGAVGGAYTEGVVYIFTKKDLEGNFINPKKISSKTTGVTLSKGDRFGYSVSISVNEKTNEETLVVSSARRVYIFTEKDSKGNFTSPKKIDSDTKGLLLKNRNFIVGSSVAITEAGNTLYVSSDKLVQSLGAFPSTIAAIRPSIGEIYIFTEKDSNDEFINPKKISSETDGLTLNNNKLYGNSVSITPDGNTLVVGVYVDGYTGEPGRGAVYIFKKK